MNKLVVNADLGKETISRHIYGHFAEHLGRCIYEGIWVGEDSPIPNTRGIRNDVVAALRKLNMPNLRWPGGCFADEYHWMDGIGPREKRPAMVNTHWGKVTESNHFGTHEFMDLCEMLQCEPYICGNVGSGTVQEMQQWVEYITFDGSSPMADLRRANGREKPWKLTYWAVGNENWGCGGQMKAQYYADLFRRYNCYCRNFSGNTLYRVACGFDYDWNEILMREAGSFMNGLSIHYYTVDWQHRTLAARFSRDEWFALIKKAWEVDEVLRRNESIMDRYDPSGKVGMILDEWGTWHEVEPGTNPGFLYQQNTMRDAVVAGLSLNVFNSYCHRLKMANIAQTINVLQAMILTEGARMMCTPTYHVFEMYKVHQDATLVPISLACSQYEAGKDSIPMLSMSASRNAAGKLNISICNVHPDNPAELQCEVRGMDFAHVTGRILTAETITAHNTFDQPNQVQPTEFDQVKVAAGGFTAVLPACSVIVLEVS